MNQNVKTWVGTVIIVIILITLGVLGYLFTSKVQAPTQQAVITPTTTDAPSQATDWHIYANKNLGYQLIFPETWKNFKAISQTTGAGMISTEFGQFPQQKPDAIGIFGIEEESLATYQQDLKDNPDGNLVFLGKSNRNSAILCSGACCSKAGYDKFINFGNDQFGDSRCKEVPAILSTFKQIDTNNTVASPVAQHPTIVNAVSYDSKNVDSLFQKYPGLKSSADFQKLINDQTLNLYVVSDTNNPDVIYFTGIFSVANGYTKFNFLNKFDSKTGVLSELYREDASKNNLFLLGILGNQLIVSRPASGISAPCSDAMLWENWAYTIDLNNVKAQPQSFAISDEKRKEVDALQKKCETDLFGPQAQ